MNYDKKKAEIDAYYAKNRRSVTPDLALKHNDAKAADPRYANEVVTHDEVCAVLIAVGKTCRKLKLTPQDVVGYNITKEVGQTFLGYLKEEGVAEDRLFRVHEMGVGVVFGYLP